MKRRVLVIFTDTILFCFTKIRILNNGQLFYLARQFHMQYQ